MKTFDVQSIGIGVPRNRVFEFVAEPGNLPKWATAFKSADKHSAHLQTPQGTAAIALRTDARRDAGTVDWTMTFPDSSVGTAYERVTPDGENRSIFSFVLMAPPVPLEAVEGAPEAQRKTLAEELVRLKAILKDDPSFTRRDGVYFYLGESLLKQGQQAEALPYFEKLIDEFQESEHLEEARKRITGLKTQAQVKPAS